MSNRIKGFTVTLENDITEEMAEVISNTIKMIRNVADVTPSVTTVDDDINRSRIKNEIRSKFYKFLKDELS